MLDFIGRRSRAYRMTDDSSVKRDLDFIPSPTSSNGPFFDPSMQSVFDNDESYRLGCPTYSCPNPTRKPGIVDKATGKDVNLFFQECGLCSWGGLVMGFLEEAWQKGDRLEQPSIEPIVTTPDPSETSTPDDDGSGDERSGW